MEKLEEIILKYLENQVRNVTFSEISSDFDEFDKSDILTAIANLEKKGKIFRNKKNEIQQWHNGLGRIYGTVRITSKGAGILKEETGELTFIHRDFLNGALTGDKVILKDIRMVKNRQEGKVEKILERTQNSIICEVVDNGHTRKLKPITDNEDIKIRVSRDELKKYVDGDRLLINLSLEREDEYFPGTIQKRVCHKDDPNSDLITIAACHGFDYDFPDAVKEEVKNIPKDISNEDISDRVDLRDKMIFTIDGADTKDIDDAISLEILPNGNYKLGVHIADVSHYVKPGSAIFEEALKRGTSLYMLDSVIPMLPRELSNGICSLNPNEDRLAKSFEMEVDKYGNIVSTKIFDSVIRSKKKMTYTAVNEILEIGIIPDGYEDFADVLKEMNNLSSKMNKKREDRGAIEFDREEIKIKTDLKGRLKNILIQSQKSAEVLIENFMLSANEAVATFIASKKLPFIYRVHNYPNQEKLLDAADMICNNNSEIKKPTSYFSSSKVIQSFLDSLHELSEYPAYSDMILRCMSKAEYSTDNIGHYGLALKKYSQVTSPIRRCPDLIDHYLLDLYKKENVKELDLVELKEELEEMALQCSERERAAQRAEYDANDMKLAEYMADHIGEQFNGMILDINDKGMTVVLDNLIEGHVAIRDIEPKSFYKYYKTKRMLMSDEHCYKLGDRIILETKTASKQQRRISFILKGHEKHKRNNESSGKIKRKVFNCGQI